MLTTDLDGISKLYLQTRENMSTGIDAVKGEDIGAVLYDLNGTPVAKPRKGRAYVTSTGKKVLVMQ